MNSQSQENQQIYQELTDSLSIEIQLYEDLHELLKAKQSAIINGKVDALRTALHKENILIQRVQAVAEQRQLRASTVGAMLNTIGSTPTLTELIEMAPPHQRHSLVTLRYQLRAIVDQIGNANRENEFLLNSSIEFVRGMIQIFLKGAEGQETVYKGNGQTAEQESNKLVDCQI